MQTKNRFLDDIAKVANSAVSSLVGVKSEMQSMIHYQLEKYLSDLDLVTREEFEAVKAMAAAARSEQKNLLSRLEKLEKKLSVKGTSKIKRTKNTNPK